MILPSRERKGDVQEDAYLDVELGLKLKTLDCGQGYMPHHTLIEHPIASRRWLQPQVASDIKCTILFLTKWSVVMFLGKIPPGSGDQFNIHFFPRMLICSG